MTRLIPVALAFFLMGVDGPHSPLINAVKDGDKVALRSLVQKKVDVNAAEPDGSTALHWASYRDDLESADLLIRSGAKVNASTALGVTPLMVAARSGYPEVVEQLLGKGATVNTHGARGQTALMWAVSQQHPEV